MRSFCLYVLNAVLLLIPATALYAQTEAPPDQIAYVQYDLAAADEESSGVYLINADGTDARQLSAGVTDCPVGQIAFTPDGSSVTFIDSGRGALVQVHVETGDETVLVNGLTDEACSVTWHPSGEYLLYIDDDVTFQLDMTDVNTAPQRVFLELTPISGPAFSPDGTLLAYVPGSTSGGQGLIVVASDSSRPREVGGDDIIGGTFTPAWHPNGDQLVVIADFFGNAPDGSVLSGRSDILVVNQGRDRVTNLTLTPDVFERNASYSPDGSQLVYSRCEPPNTLQNCDLVVSTADGSKGVALLEADAAVSYAFPIWRPTPTDEPS